MKNLLLLLLTACSLTHLIGQSVPKYVMLEHFTNSRCGICASRNPAFFDLIEQYPSQVHHISYHPSFPYSTCVFYLGNTTENSARADYYNIDGTPRVVLNGLLVPLATSLLPAATLNTALAQTSPVYVQVSETSETVTVRVYTVGELTAGNTYKLYIALAEKTINQATPNGENVHHNVFRDLLVENVLDLAPTGEFVEFTFTKTTVSSWNADEIYALAWVQNTTTAEILNSGTKFDPVITSVNAAPVAGVVQFAPNPSSSVSTATLPDGEAPASVQLFSMDGRLVQADFTTDGRVLTLETAALQAGMYYAVITTKNGVYSSKLSKI
jgi:hypothetical protein